jgi:hypothetical protein
MLKKILRLTATLSIVLSLASCQVQNGLQSTQKSTYLPSPTSVPQLTETEATTPSLVPDIVAEIEPTPTSQAATATPVPTPTSQAATATPVPTPLFPASQVAHSLLLSTGASSTCELPCWHNLRIGISNQANVENVFMRLFDAEGGFDFFAPPAYHGSELARQLLNVEGTYVGGHKWSFEESETGLLGTYYLYAFMDENTGLLLGIREIIDPYTVYAAPTLPEVVERLGKPDWVYGGQIVSGFVVTVIYERGIKIQLTIPFRNNIDTSTALFCFDEEPISGSYIIVDPYVSLNDEDWSIMQKASGAPIDTAPYIDEGLGMSSIDEFVEFVTSDDPCIEVPR